MRRGVDTNVLVYTHLPGNPEQHTVREFFLDQLADRSMILVVAPLILHEFVHLVTDSKRFDPPVSMSEATATARLYLRRTNVACLGMDEDATMDALSLIERHRLGRTRVADALIAATLIRNDVAEIITCNPSDFEVFDDLRVIDPRNSESTRGR